MTLPNEELLTEEKCKEINNNIYLIDFLKYMLIRDPRHRPSISNVLKRFKHVYALLVNTSSRGFLRLECSSTPSPLSGGSLRPVTLEGILESCNEIMCPKPFGDVIPERIFTGFRHKHTPSMMKLFSDFFLATKDYLLHNMKTIFHLGVTHIVLPQSALSNQIANSFTLLLVNTHDKNT